MPQISEKGRQMPASPIRKLVPFAEKAEARGIKIHYLNIGQPDIETPQIALDAVKKIDFKTLAYSHSAGFPEYRKKLAASYQNIGLPVSEDEILVTTGGSEALSFIIGSIADAGDEIIIPEPFYANYNGFATANSVVVKPITSSIETNFALPAIEAFEQLITPKTRAILICNPGNPTGYLYTKEEINQLAELALKHDIFLIADEVYRDFVYDHSEHYSILSVKNLEEHAIMVDSVSKKFSMCGARIGCIVTKNKAVYNAALKFAQARLSPPSLAQIASEAALETPPSYFDAVNQEYVARRNLLIEGLQSIPGVKVAKPKGAFYCIAQLPVKDSDHFAQWLLDSFNHQGKTVMVAPAAGFYSSEGLGMNQIRIAYVLKKEDLAEAVEILKMALESYPERC